MRKTIFISKKSIYMTGKELIDCFLKFFITECISDGYHVDRVYVIKIALQVHIIIA